MEVFTESFLTGKELLLNKGIRYETVDEYERLSKLLPKTGKKLFEPNGTWLQLKQVEKSIQHRRDLLVMERVERKSQLAVAEWLSHENKVRVLKKSGKVCANFGTEINTVLFLIPEEALSLVEMNSIELLWERVPMSVQQAYSMLLNLNNAGCIWEKYKVYNQFVRYGYRLKRCYNALSRKKEINSRESIPKLNKVIILPYNGLRMIDNENKRVNACYNIFSHEPEIRHLKEIHSSNDSDVVKDCVHEVLENIIFQLESRELKGVVKDCQKSKIFVNNTSLNSENEKNSNAENGKETILKSNNECTTDQNGKLETGVASNHHQLEVIELSDDEEFFKPVTQFKILYQLPNIASQSMRMISKNLSNYIPRSIQLRKDVYDYEKLKCLNGNGSNKCNILSQETNRHKKDTYMRQNTTENFAETSSGWKTSVHLHNKSFYEQMFNSHKNDYSALQQTNQFDSFHYFQYYNKNNFFYQNSKHLFLKNSVHQWPNRYFLGNNCNNSLVGLMGSLMNLQLMRNFSPNYRPTFVRNPNYVYQQSSSNGNTHATTCRPTELPTTSAAVNDNSTPITDNGVEPSTWQQYIKKKEEEQTITIDDDQKQHSEQFHKKNFQEKIKPLLHLKRTTHLLGVNGKLKLIKPFVKEPQEKRNLDEKIYKIYSNSVHYRKSNPGPPDCHLLVVREKDKHYLNSGEMHYFLHQKYKSFVIAYASRTSVSYIQFGNVFVPDLI